MFGTDETDTLDKDAYAADVTMRVYATIVDQARRVVAAGQAAVVDAVFAKPEEREVVEWSGIVLGVPWHGLFLDADLPVRVARIGRRGPDASDADAAIAHQQESYDLGGLAWPRVDASGTPNETLAAARQVIGG